MRKRQVMKEYKNSLQSIQSITLDQAFEMVCHYLHRSNPKEICYFLDKNLLDLGSYRFNLHTCERTILESKPYEVVR